MRKGSMMVRTESVYRSAAGQEFAIDPALHCTPVNFQTPRCLFVASGLLVYDRRVARERLLGGELTRPQIRRELLNRIFRRGAGWPVIAADEHVPHALFQFAVIPRPRIIWFQM